MEFYKHNIPAWMDGTEGLDDGPYRAYHVICQLIYLHDGPIVLNESGIAGRCNQHPLAFRRNLQVLVDLGKITRLPENKITNARTEREIAKVKKPRPTSNPGPTPAQPPGGPAGVREGSAGGSAAKPLKTKEATPAADPLEKRREEKIPGAKAPGVSGVDLERELFERGKRVLGKSAGGMITNLLKAKRYDYAAAMQTIEDASAKHSPREYVAGAIRSAAAPVKHGGAAAAMKALREAGEQQEGFDHGSTGTDHPGGEIIPAGSTRGDHAHLVRARGR